MASSAFRLGMPRIVRACFLASSSFIVYPHTMNAPSAISTATPATTANTSIIVLPDSLQDRRTDRSACAARPSSACGLHRHDHRTRPCRRRPPAELVRPSDDHPRGLRLRVHERVDTTEGRVLASNAVPKGRPLLAPRRRVPNLVVPPGR